jgi:hypothetical protein
LLGLLRDMAIAGLSCVARINDGRCPVRAPDYYSFNYSFSPGPIPIIFGGNITISRQGHVFYGIDAGVGAPGISGAVRGGFIDQPRPPTPQAIDNFVHGGFVTGEVTPAIYPVPLAFGVGPSVAETWGQPYPPQGGSHNRSTEIGVGFSVVATGALMGGYDWGGWQLP